ncbi:MULTISPECIES: hypothetical protein [unclassified Lysobacter]|uniref:hypothetical protein n=1 Tax=unclassified Lysobacter TaxID=2635362 RepID=UPI001BE818D7|nr:MULTISPECIES: hypothetical protein [unclassified Lysobacter]MBT2750029.1 hypothetical protein [Lysobacter sp. ISL-50]MBT2775399.1 hypothetical protein [Lysobacter sp. ISL-54]MBT2783522.1 hypothetical protein [Lysobacter sp. ISL-52]
MSAKINGAPGAFSVISASVTYEVGPTKGCMPDAEPFTGVFPTPDTASTKSKVNVVSPSEYTFDVYLDGMVSKDYFGKGTCTWLVQSAGITIARSANPDFLGFGASLNEAELKSGKPVVLYLPRKPYFDPPKRLDSTMYPTSESGLTEDVLRSVGRFDPANSFTITLTATAKD